MLSSQNILICLLKLSHLFPSIHRYPIIQIKKRMILKLHIIHINVLYYTDSGNEQKILSFFNETILMLPKTKYIKVCYWVKFIKHTILCFVKIQKDCEIFLLKLKYIVAEILSPNLFRQNAVDPMLRSQ